MKQWLVVDSSGNTRSVWLEDGESLKPGWNKKPTKPVVERLRDLTAGSGENVDLVWGKADD
jgi:hypothetical protein